ncbi:MAG: CPBP family intramembrane metalloprotease [Bacteroidales bacterium]|nr:CPBP family intramembrane metalloprotease [Bacteroidales bacterium]
MNKIMGSKYSNTLLVILGYVAYYVLINCRFIPGSDGELHTFYGTLLPDALDGIWQESQIFRNVWANSIAAIPLVVVMFILHKAKDVLKEWGIAGSGFALGLLVGLLMTVPMFITNAICGTYVFSMDNLLLSLWAGLSEEIIFRGYLFGQLHRKCNWGYIWASLPAAIVFGMGHLYQSGQGLSALSVFAVTAFGSFYFGWLYREWNFNLWVPISLHAFMDLAWMLFPLSDEYYGAVGTVAGNVGRVLTIILSVIITIIYKRRRGEKLFDYKIV